VRVEIELHESFVAKLDHADAHPVLADVQLADDALGEVLDAIPVAFVMLVDTSRRVDDEHDVGPRMT